MTVENVAINIERKMEKISMSPLIAANVVAHGVGTYQHMVFRACLQCSYWNVDILSVFSFELY